MNGLNRCDYSLKQVQILGFTFNTSCYRRDIALSDRAETAKRETEKKNVGKPEP